MIPIQNLLERFKNLKNTDKTRKQLIIELLSKNNIPLKIDQIFFNKKIVIIKVQPIIKTEILLKKEYLLLEIKKIPGLENISNIQ